MVAAAACGGDVLVKNVIPKHLESISAKLEEAGAEIIEYDDAVRITRFKPLTRCNVKTMPHRASPRICSPRWRCFCLWRRAPVSLPRVCGTIASSM